MNEILKNFRRLKKEVKTLSSVGLKSYLEHNRWNVINSDAESASRILETLNLAEKSRILQSFTYSENNTNIVVVKCDIGETDLVFLLLHEIGHIMLKHNFSYLSVRDEKEATKFADFCISAYSFDRYKQPIILAGAILALACIMIAQNPVSITTSKNDSSMPTTTSEQTHSQEKASSDTYSKEQVSSKEQTYSSKQASSKPPAYSKEQTPSNRQTIPREQTETVYITKTGTKYHHSDCHYIKGKTNLVTLSIGEAENGGYDACSVCFK